MKMLVKYIPGGIIGTSVLAGGVALTHCWGEEAHHGGNDGMFRHNSEMHQGGSSQLGH